MNLFNNIKEAFLKAATWHGGLEEAEALQAAHPELTAGGDLHVAAVLGDDAAVRRCLAGDPASATAKTGPYDCDAIVLLGLSKYLRLDSARSDAFLRAAEALLDAGADPNSGFWTTGEYPEFETALYGAAGVAHHEALTRLLLDRGADPNDGDTTYHAPEGYDLGALKALVETGKLTPDSLATMLLRKHDWHDLEGVKYLLANGASPNYPGQWSIPPAYQAIRRDNGTTIIEALLDAGADFTVPIDGLTGIVRAARRGRGDLLDLFAARGISTELAGVDRLIVACARNDAGAIAALTSAEPGLTAEVQSLGPQLLAEFAGNGNSEGVARLLDLGVPIDARYPGDGYFGIAADSTALHVAAWRAHPDTVKLLIDRGAPLDVLDANGRTPLTLAVKACVDAHWSYRRTPDSVLALLAAGASIKNVPYPSGYDEVDALLRNAGAS